jgi:hypothetical protein
MKMAVLLFTAFLSSPSLAMEQITNNDLSLETGVEVTAIKAQPLPTTRLSQNYERVAVKEIKKINRSIAAKHVR